jgi:hypothetical protein
VSFTPQALECTTFIWTILIYGATPSSADISTERLLGLLKGGNLQYFAADRAFTTYTILHFVVFTISLTVLTASII